MAPSPVKLLDETRDRTWDYHVLHTSIRHFLCFKRPTRNRRDCPIGRHGQV